MSKKPYISAWSLIRDAQWNRNGESISANKEEGLPAILKHFYKQSGKKYPKFFKMDELSKLAFVATEWLQEKTAFSDRYQDEEIGVILANAAASLHTDRKYQETIADFPSPGLFVYTLPNVAAGEICIRHKIQGENAFFITESFQPELLCDYVNDLMDREMIQAAVTGWVECDGNNYEAFLYFVEKSPTITKDQVWEHTAENINTLYKNHGNTNTKA